MSTLFDGLPTLLAEIAEVVADALDSPAEGLRAALAISAAKGGQRVRILPEIKDNAWLITAVGIDVAKVIVALYTVEGMGEQINIPMGMGKGYNEQRSKRRRIIEEGLAQARPIAEIARDAECTDRYVFWLKARLKGAAAQDKRQMLLFKEDAA
jgi:hypothetical protein